MAGDRPARTPLAAGPAPSCRAVRQTARSSRTSCSAGSPPSAHGDRPYVACLQRGEPVSHRGHDQGLDSASSVRGADRHGRRRAGRRPGADLGPAPGRHRLATPAPIWSDGCMGVTRHGGRWTLEDRFASAWQYLPVEVPPGSFALRVELDYDRSGAVLDLGCIGPAGFRGWSGGARRSFVIAADCATPGYLPGELEPGTWQVMIGLHRVPPGGAEYRVTVEVSSTPGELRPDTVPEDLPPLTDRPPRRALPATDGRRWLAGDLHTHTVHSDGVMTVPELARFAAGRGMEFIAVTDHNTVSHHAELPAAAAAHGIVLVPGQEVTIDTGHANAFGDIGWIDFREPPDAWLEATEQAGGLLSINHPIGGHVSWATPMKRRPPLVEVWHWSWLDTHWTT